MDAKELRSLSSEEVRAKVNGWREELFRAKIRLHTSEMKDTSVLGKLRKDIARGLTILSEGTETKGAPQDQPVKKEKAEDKA